MARPSKPKVWPKNTINIKRDDILIIAEYPILVDSAACNFALKIEDRESGINDIDKICRLKIPSKYFGNRFSTTKGARKNVRITKNIEIKITRRLIFLWDVPLDSSDNKKACNAVGNNSNAKRICKLN